VTARPIHRFSAEDRHFRGARIGGLADAMPGTAAIFGLSACADAARSVRDASWALDGPSPSMLLDLGDTSADVSATAGAIQKHGFRPFLLSAGIEGAVAAIGQCRYDVAIVACNTLPFVPEALGAVPLVCVGLHDLVPAKAMRAWRKAGALFVPATGATSFGGRLLAALRTLRKGARAALVLDVGVIDTGHAAAAACVNVGGLTVLETVDAIGSIGAYLDIVAFAATGLHADLDPRGHTELVVAAAVEAAARGGDR
jgi:hypothetical protein